MSVKIDLSGLEKLKKNLEKLDGTHEVQLGDLLTPKFILAHTKFSDLDDLLKSSGFKVDSAEDFKAIPDEEWDAFIKANSDFESWSEMQKTAGAEYFSGRLTEGL